MRLIFEVEVVVEEACDDAVLGDLVLIFVAALISPCWVVPTGDAIWDEGDWSGGLYGGGSLRDPLLEEEVLRFSFLL